MDTTSQPAAPTGLSVSVSRVDSSDLYEIVLDLLKKFGRGFTDSRSRAETLWLLLKVMFFAGCGGLIVAAVAGLGQTLAIGIVPAWKLYGTWWILSPLLGCAFLLFAVSLPLLLKGAERVTTGFAASVSGGRLSPAASTTLSLTIALGCTFAIAGYLNARKEYPLLSSTANDIGAISSAAQQQTNVLNNVSETSESLLRQLTATEKELEEAKQQLQVTLANFNEQRQAADRVSEEMKRLETRRLQIAIKTAELERILEGHDPITREDLRRSTNSGLVYGAFIGFLMSLAAAYAFSLFQTK